MLNSTSGAITGVVTSVAPAADVLTWAEMKAFLRIDTDDEQLIGEAIIKAATNLTENWTGLALISQTKQQYFDGWPRRQDSTRALDVFRFRAFPVSSLTKIEYQATVGAWTELASTNYIADLVADPPIVAWSEDHDLPTLADAPSAVRMEYVTGYANAAAVPRDMRQAALLLCGHLWENREATSHGVSLSDVPMGYESLLRPHARVIHW